jgi:hypothetical protein
MYGSQKTCREESRSEDETSREKDGAQGEEIGKKGRP